MYLMLNSYTLLVNVIFLVWAQLIDLFPSWFDLWTTSCSTWNRRNMVNDTTHWKMTVLNRDLMPSPDIRSNKSRWTTDANML